MGIKVKTPAAGTTGVSKKGAMVFYPARAIADGASVNWVASDGAI